MKNPKEAAKETAKPQPQPTAPVPAQNGKAKALKAKPEAKAKVKKDEEPVDRLPITVEELKTTKGGLVTFLLLNGRTKEEITKELAVAFKLGEEPAAKIVRRITGRARFFQRAFSLVPAK